MPWIFLPCLIWPSLSSLGIALALLSRAFEWPRMTLPWDYNNPWLHPMSTGGQPRRKAGAVGYYPCFLSFSGHFSTSSGSNSFFFLDIPRGLGVPIDGPGCLGPSSLAYFGIRLARLVSGPFQGTSVPSISLRNTFSPLTFFGSLVRVRGSSNLPSLPSFAFHWLAWHCPH